MIIFYIWMGLGFLNWLRCLCRVTEDIWDVVICLLVLPYAMVIGPLPLIFAL